MASENLRKYVDDGKNLIQENGLQDSYLKGLTEALRTAFEVEKDIEFARELGNYLKTTINSEIKRLTGADFWALEKYCFANKKSYKILDDYYNVLLIEARNMVLDSYLMYLEKNRIPKDRFYMPKRKQFLKIGLTQALQDMLDDKLDVLSISLPPGTGKLLSDDTKVLTTNGWKNHGDLVVGDYVYGLDGKAKMVQHIFPKNYANCKITFSNGQEIECHENHEWLVHDRKRGCERIVETKIFFKNKLDSGVPNKRGHRYHYMLPKREPILGEYRALEVNPYILGAWLGDGTEKKPIITICDTDLEIVREFEKEYELSAVYTQVGCKAYHFLKLRQDLQKLGMCHSRNKLGKRIPEHYLTASIEQRLELLAGLLDTDGCCRADEKKYSYSTTNEELKDGIISLISSFGWRCCVVKANDNRGRYNSNLPCYVISFSPEFKIPCRVLRKQLNEFSTQRKISITKVEHIEPKQGNCIQVEGGIYCVGEKMIPTHNSTLEKFFHSGVCGWFPEEYSLFLSHSAGITRMYYDGVLAMLTDSSEYTWGEIFPECQVTNTNAKLEQITINNYKPFPNVQTGSVGSELAGKVRASKFLFMDDLIGKIEEALNKNILDKLWNFYSTDALQRKTVDSNDKPCKELLIATRWSVHDPIGRIKAELDGDPRARFIAVPDIDPETGLSNFNYEFKGMDEEFFKKQERFMDDISYRCLYKNDPIEREGLLYHDDELRRYFDMPLREPDAIIGVCDTKSKGTDFLVMPIMYQYDDDYYMVDCICTDSSDYGVQYGRMANMILEHNMQQVEFESNAGGDRVAFEVDKLVKDGNGRCNITTKPTETNKETRIIVNADWIKKHVLFKDKELYKPKSDYGVFMDWLLCYSVAGKNVHDDVPDCLANFALYVTKKARVATVEAVMNPFRMRGY